MYYGKANFQKWEYLTVLAHKEKPSDDDLNQLGYDGWELVGAAAWYFDVLSEQHLHPTNRLYFKRPKV